MNFTFLNGAFLFAALAALLPLLIHLISRRRVATIDFSSLRFLKELERKRIRRVRLRQILLLIVRSLIILAAALALSRPTLKGPLAGAGGSHARTSVAIVLDESASMTRTPDGGDLLGQAKRAAREIAALLDEGDQAFLVSAGAPPRAVLRDGTFSPDALLEAIDEMEAGVSATDLSGAVDLSLSLLDQSRNLNRELYVLSDLQRTGWQEPAVDGALGRARRGEGTDRGESTDEGEGAGGDDGGPRTYLLSFEGPTSNLALSSAIVERKYGGAAGLYSVSASVSSHSHRNTEAMVKLFVDGEQSGQAGVEVERDGSAVARFALTVDESSWHGGWVELPPDALESDNRQYFVIPPARLTEVLVVRPDGAHELDDADYVERALDPTAESRRFSVSMVELDALPSQSEGRFPVVVLADVGRLDDAAEYWIDRHVSAGGGVLVVLGNRTDVRFWNAELLPGLVGTEILAPMERSDGVRLAPALQGHPLLEGLVFGERLIDDIAVRRAFLVSAAGTEEILELPGVGPALVVGARAQARGEVAVLLTGLDPTWSDLPRSGFVVPLMHRLVERLSRTVARPASVTIGEDLLAGLVSSPAGRIEAELPSGGSVTTELRRTGSPAAVVRSAGEPGVYRFHMDGRTVALGAVNVDPNESDLVAAERSEVESALSPLAVTFVERDAGLADEVLQARYGRELWRAFLYVALALVALEMYLARPRYR